MRYTLLTVIIALNVPSHSSSSTQDKKIEKLIEASNGGDLILTEDWSGVNSGVWIANNTPWTRKFLRIAFEQKQLDEPYASNGAKHPFEYEQRAFHYLLDTEVWKKRGLPKYKGDSVEMRRHVRYSTEDEFELFFATLLFINLSRENV